MAVGECDRVAEELAQGGATGCHQRIVVREGECRRFDLVLGEENKRRSIAEWDERVLARDPRELPVVAGVDQHRHDSLGDAARAPGLVDDEDPLRGDRLAGDVLDRQRRQPAQIDDAGLDATLLERGAPPAATSGGRCPR